MGYDKLVHMKTLNELKQEQKLIKKQILNLGPVIEGSIAQNGWHCKNKNCKCNTKGELHRSTILCWREEGKSYAKHIPKALHKEVRQWVENRKKMKALIKKCAAIQRDIFYLLREEAKKK
jgi:hypothetical protein